MYKYLCSLLAYGSWNIILRYTPRGGIAKSHNEPIFHFVGKLSFLFPWWLSTIALLIEMNKDHSFPTSFPSVYCHLFY